MRYLLPLLLLCTLITNAQKHTNNKMYSMAYLYTFKLQELDNYLRTENMSLFVDKNASSFQSYNQRKLDTLKVRGTATDDDQAKYFSFNRYNIHMINDSITYTEDIKDDEYVYYEKLNYRWTLGDKTKSINGYSCKNAFISYGGRDWEAWYTMDLPINAGPYKFKGLPGLIVKIGDSLGHHDFELALLVERNKKPLEKVYHSKDQEARIITNRQWFNDYKRFYHSLSLNEKMNLGKSGSKSQFKRVDGNNSITRNVGDETDKRIFIEIDREK